MHANLVFLRDVNVIFLIACHLIAINAQDMSYVMTQLQLVLVICYKGHFVSVMALHLI